MKLKNPRLFLNREDAVQKLLEKLCVYRNSGSCVVSTSKGGLALASPVAKALGGDLFFIPSKIFRHPGDPQRTVGVVTPEHAIMHDLDRDIPQEFVYRKTRTLQSSLASRYQRAYSPIASRFQGRIVILVEDCVESMEKVLACVETIREQKPRKIVIVAPVISSRVVNDFITEADSVVFLNIVSDKAIRSACEDFDLISDEDVAELMEISLETT